MSRHNLNPDIIEDQVTTAAVKKPEIRITLRSIEIALAQCATIIETNPRGHKLWPVFERLEAERDKLADRSSRLTLAKQRLTAPRPGRMEAQS